MEFVGIYEEKTLVLEGNKCIFNIRDGETKLEGEMGQRSPSRLYMLCSF